MSSRNTPQFLADTLRELQSAGISVWVFGGWAEELHGIRPPGPHGDIDLLYPAEDFSAVDQFLQSRTDLEEVQGKRFIHKRAFVRQGVLVELFLLRRAAARYATDFFGVCEFLWPEDALSEMRLLGVPTLAASSAALRFYRERHTAIEQAYRQHLALKENGRQQAMPQIKPR